MISDNTDQAYKERQAFMKKVMDSVSDPLSDLYGRWQEEMNYEDPKDYKQEIGRIVLAVTPAGTTVERTQVQKHGLACAIQIPEFPYKCVIFVNARNVGWKSSM
jgi:tryptophan synthase beta subunit